MNKLFLVFALLLTTGCTNTSPSTSLQTGPAAPAVSAAKPEPVAVTKAMAIPAGFKTLLGKTCTGRNVAGAEIIEAAQLVGGKLVFHHHWEWLRQSGTDPSLQATVLSGGSVRYVTSQGWTYTATARAGGYHVVADNPDSMWKQDEFDMSCPGTAAQNKAN